jgi:membrane-anchored mycosin MYCP
MNLALRIAIAAFGIATLAGAPAAFAATDGAPVRIAVIDGGMARTGELADSIESETDFVEGRQAFSAKSDHGTAVATVIKRSAGRPVRILSMRVDKDGKCGSEGCTFDIAAVRAAVKAAVAARVDMINMSLETPFDVQLYVMLKGATDSGVVVVMAAGNQRRVPQGLRYAQMLGRNFWLVGANDQQGATDCGCQFVWRTGVDVATQTRKGQSTTMSGTSFAAPRLVGELASKSVTQAPITLAAR